MHNFLNGENLCRMKMNKMVTAATAASVKISENNLEVFLLLFAKLKNISMVIN